MNQKERMLANLPYRSWLDGLSEERMETKKKLFEYNNTPPDQEEKKMDMLKDILGKTGDRCRQSLQSSKRDYRRRQRLLLP